MLPLLIYLVIQMVVILLVFSFGGVFNNVKGNTLTMFESTIKVRGEYVEKEMAERWSNVTNAVEELNALYGTYGKPIANDGETQGFYEHAYNVLIDTIKNNAVTGSFVILQPQPQHINRHDGLYLHCESPASVTDDSVFINVATEYMIDLLSRKHSLQMGYKSYFELDDDALYYRNPFNEAVKDPAVDAVNYGYWSDTHNILRDAAEVISYTVPLVHGNTVYGVFGVEVSSGYIKRSLPYRELAGENSNGAYVLAKQKAGETDYRVMAKNGTDFIYFFGDKASQIGGTVRKDGLLQLNDISVKDTAVGLVYPLQLYNHNTPFESEKWFLLGLAPEDVLLADYNRMLYMVILSFSVSVVIGVGLMVVLAKFITRPVVRLSNQTVQMYHNPGMILDKTGIKELDTLVHSIEDLSANVMESASKLSKVIELSGMPLGAFELNDVTQKVDYTDKFPKIIGKADEITPQITAAQLRKVFENMNKVTAQSEDDTPVYTYIDDVGSQHWVTLRTVNSPNHLMGVVEDITEETIKKNRMEYDRDFDGLTGLLNRRAFLARAGKLFTNMSNLKHAALIMMDLDNLKMINDTYGHSYGDEYIKVTARTIKSFVPRGESMGARMSGDEFLVLLYGYENHDSLTADVNKLRAFLAETTVLLPQRKTIKVRCSGGYACCPEDATDMEELVRYADFAMYEVKHTTKGAFNCFMPEKYMDREYRIDSYEKLDNLIDNNLVEYKYQPIVSLKTGKVRAYEALMRSLEPSLATPGEILNAAREQHKLFAIERLTWRNAINGYARFKNEFNGARIFINSIPNQILDEAERKQLGEEYADVLERTVIEFTEEEKLNEEMANTKKEFIQHFGGKVAVDDFGAGYSNDTILLFLNPHYIKVDMYIIKNVNEDRGKQKLLENIVAYAMERKIKTIAEGVETRAELETVSRLGVDYVQGFYVAGPEFVPTGISAAKRREIVDVYNKTHAKNKNPLPDADDEM